MTSNFKAGEYAIYKKQADKAIFKSPEEEYEHASNNHKVCSKCKINKDLNEYGGNTSGTDAFNKEGYRLRRPECKDCNKIVLRGKQEAKEVAKKNNIPYKAPEGTVCALCECPEKPGDGLVFDHCHETNCFRGYLHNSCNRSLGVLGDDIAGMLRAINYLNKTEKKKFTQNEDGDIIIED